MALITLILLAVLALGSTAVSTDAQGVVEVTGRSVEYSYGEAITFQVDYESSLEVDQITLVVTAPGLPAFVGGVAQVAPGQGEFVYLVSDRPLPAFASIAYQFQFALNDGQLVSSPRYEFTYLDNRFNWQELVSDPFRIYWYEGEITLAQEVLDAALAGQSQTLELLQQPPNLDPITIFIYSSEAELQDSLSVVGQTWVSGYADPARGSIVVALPPAVDQPLEIQRLIPHEIAHILLYRFMGAEYQYLPTWLNEGLASRMEIYSLPEYQLALDRAQENRELIPMVHLCQAFPGDADLALLAYAQSQALVDYIQEEYGLAGLQSLISAYDQGLSCERGVEVALGTSLTALERSWLRDTYSRSSLLLLIYILAGALIMLAAGLGGFIYLKVRQNPAEELWDEEES